MRYAKNLRQLFPDISISFQDLFLLESFQISYLPERVPEKEFAALMHQHPILKEFLIRKDPSIGSFIDFVMQSNPRMIDEESARKNCDELLWEIADLIVYNKHPEVYDEMVKFEWDLNEIIHPTSLRGKEVADIGAGSGKLSFLLADYAEVVFAIEPVTSFRTFIRNKVFENDYTNIYVSDGFLDSIPLKDNSLDVLFTSNSIGWNIEKELPEIERVVKSGGNVFHLMRAKPGMDKNPIHEVLTSNAWKYEFSESKDGLNRKYYKTVQYG